MLKSVELADIMRLRIHKGVTVNLNSQWKKDRVRNAYTRLYYITAGQGYLKYGEETVVLEPGFAYLIPADLTFSYGCTELSKIFFHVSLSATENYDLLSGIDRICKIPYPMEKTQEMIRCHTSRDYYDLIRLKMQILETILLCREQYALPPILCKQYSDLVKRSMEYIRKNISLKLRAETVAKAVFTSTSTLRRVFKEETDKTVGKYIEEYVFLRAKQMLADTELSVGDISRKLGFCDQFYFSRRFKAHFGMPPSRFQKEISGE